MNDDPRATDTGVPARSEVAFRLRVAHGRGELGPVRGRTLLAITLPPPSVTLLVVLTVLVAFAVDLPGLTVALLTAGTGNPANEVQANTVRLATEGGEGPAFVVPALMPGETVDRAIGIRSTGTGDAQIGRAHV